MEKQRMQVQSLKFKVESEVANLISAGGLQHVAGDPLPSVDGSPQGGKLLPFGETERGQLHLVHSCVSPQNHHAYGKIIHKINNKKTSRASLTPLLWRGWGRLQNLTAYEKNLRKMNPIDPKKERRTRSMRLAVLNRLARKHSVIPNPVVDAAFPARRGARVLIRLRDGREFEHLQTDRKGDPELPLSDADLEHKLLELSASTLSPHAAQALIRRIWALHEEHPLP